MDREDRSHVVSSDVQSTMKRSFHISTGYIVLAFGMLLLLTGCKSNELQALEDSASLIQLTTGQEAGRWHQDKGVTLGKPVYAKVVIDYEPLDGFSEEDVYDEITTVLINHDWQRDKYNVVPGYFTASLQQDRIRLTVAVLAQPDKNLVTVYLEAP